MRTLEKNSKQKAIQVFKDKQISENMDEIELLREFLEYPIWTSEPVFERFKKLEGAIFRESQGNSKERFLYLEGKRENKVVLVAHADTYFDEFYRNYGEDHEVVEVGGFFVGRKNKIERVGLGADDRAGCAILWALKDSGHSLLITDGEELGRIGSSWLMENNKDIAQRLQSHQFMVQFDRCNAQDFKCYEVGTEEFRKFIEDQTGYSEPNRSSYTDICTLCTNICGVNLSVGYYYEHTDCEKIKPSEWLNTLQIARRMLEGELPRFER